MFTVCACARFQVTPKTSHLLAVKRIFRYLKGKPTLGLWYSRDSPFELVAYTDSDYAGATQDRKSTTGGCQFWCTGLISCSKISVLGYPNQKHLGMSKEVETPRYLSLVVPLKKVGNEAVHKELGDKMERAATTASSLEAEQDSSGPRCQDTILGDVNAQTRFEITSKQSNDLPLSRGYTLGSGKDSFQQIVDFLNISHIKFALTKSPTIYTSLIQQFWQTTSTSTLEDGEVEIITTIDGQLKTITEASLRRHLKLEDTDGISSLPNTEIFKQLALMGYASDFDKLTFQKGCFFPQWRFLIHTILHCLSPKKTAWEQFSSNIATAIICLATNTTFNFSKMIFEGM
ncbi:hypothetical protein Tco_0336224 [Tanacetum coccineum]